jgi:hypothetical protein
MDSRPVHFLTANHFRGEAQNEEQMNIHATARSKMKGLRICCLKVISERRAINRRGKNASRNGARAGSPKSSLEVVLEALEGVAHKRQSHLWGILGLRLSCLRLGGRNCLDADSVKVVRWEICRVGLGCQLRPERGIDGPK